MSLRESVKVTVEVRAFCPICGAEGKPAEGGGIEWQCVWQCPTKVLSLLQNALHLRTHRRKIRCPKCMDGICWRNSSDYFECTSCKTQYVREGGFIGDDTWEHVTLIDENVDDIQGCQIPSLVLPEKGEGDFPVEQDWKLRIKKAERARQRMERLLNSMRKWLGCREIFFNGNGFVAPQSLETIVQGLLLQYGYTRTLF